jgi:hypothetical protein
VAKKREMGSEETVKVLRYRPFFRLGFMLVFVFSFWISDYYVVASLTFDVHFFRFYHLLYMSEYACLNSFRVVVCSL